MRTVLVAVLLVLPMLAAPPRAGAADRPLVVYAAASLTAAFQAVAPAFHRAQPGWKIRFNFGASSTLRAQIQRGAPADVFASADEAQMEPLAAARLGTGARPFARNRLALVVPAANPARIESAKDLAQPGLRVVAAGDAVPVGHYTRQLFANLARTEGYPADFGQRVDRNVVSREANVRAMLARVELGEADAAVVYETDARSAPRVKGIPLPKAANVTATYPVAVVAASGNRAGPRRSSASWGGKAGQGILGAVRVLLMSSSVPAPRCRPGLPARHRLANA